MLISVNMGSCGERRACQKENKNKKAKPGDTSAMRGQFPGHLRAVQASVFQVLPDGLPKEEPESFPAEGVL